jgi:hypothetical protein
MSKKKRPPEGQLGLLDRFAPYVKGSDTSKEAADSMTDEELGRLERLVYATIEKAGEQGRIDDEVTVLTEPVHHWTGPSSAAARRVALVKRGLVVDSGKRRKTRSNKNATVWVTKEHQDGTQA